MRKVIAATALVVAFAAIASAQAPASAREDLSGLPESQAVLFVNARRITNEALPALVPASKYQPLFDQAKVANVDVQKIDYLIVGARFAGAPASAASPVEFGLIVRGGINADALLSMARLAAGGGDKYREETRGGKTVSIFKANVNAFGAQKLAEEIAAVSVGPDALLVGTPAYVAAALDARGGAGARIRADLVDLVTRDDAALVSLAGDVPPSLSSYIDSPGGAKMDIGVLGLNGEARRLIDSLRQIQFSLNMTAAQFGAQLAARTDSPENARAISGLIATGLNAIQQEASEDAARKGRVWTAKDAQALALLKSITNTAEGDEVSLSLSVPQSTVASYVRQMMAPKPAPKAATRTAARPGPRRRARRRG